MVEFRKGDAATLVEGTELGIGSEHFSHATLLGEFLTHSKCA